MPLDDHKYKAAIEACLTSLKTTRSELESNIDGRHWLAWSCHCSRLGAHNEWAWRFRDEFDGHPPKWLDIDIPDQTNIIGAIVNARLPLDAGLCNFNSGSAIESAMPGYANVFRVRQRDNSICWVDERVGIVWQNPDSLVLLGIIRKAEDTSIAEGKRALEAFEALGRSELPEDLPKSDADLKRQLETLKRDVRLLVRSGRWLIWAAEVRQVSVDPPQLHWHFQRDFVQVLPEWFDIERIPFEDLVLTLGRSRLPEDDEMCGRNAQQAFLTDQSGYHQVFRVRLRDGRISYIDEQVSLQRIGPDSWHVVGVCIDATARKEAEDKLVAQNEALQDMQAELQTQQAELLAQNEELQDMQTELQSQQTELQAQNEELHRLQLVLQEEKAALAAANERLAGLATTDGLTGLKNHRALREQLDLEIRNSARYHTPLSFILLDIDHFKRLNDEFGHPAGDAALVQMANVLRETARDTDFTARYGGEEFAIIMPRTDSSGAVALAERFRSNIEKAQWPDRRITGSLGVATTSIDCTTADELVARADRALYRAKSCGRNCVVSHQAL